MPNFIGIDIGTTAIKGLLVSGEGEVLSRVYRKRGQSTQAEVDSPEGLWVEFKNVISELFERHAGSREVFGLALSGVVPNICLVNRDDEVIHPILRYSDRRAYEIELQLDAELQNGEWQNEVLSKLIWLRDNVIDHSSKDLKFFSPHNWLVYRLTGEYVIDNVSAAEHGCVFDTRLGDWNGEIAENFDIDFIDWPKIVGPFDEVGEIKKSTAQELGFEGRNAVKVAAGGPDFLASLLGSGAREPEDMMIYIGTYHCACRLRASADSLGTYRGTDGPIEWLATIPQVGPQCESAAEYATGLRGQEAWLKLEELAGQQVEPDCCAYFVPCVQLLSSTISTVPTSVTFFEGPSRDPRSWAQAIYLGIALGLKIDLERRGCPADISRVFLSGGGARSHHQRQVLSDVLQRQLKFVSASEEGLGTALMALRMDTAASFVTIDKHWNAVDISPREKDFREQELFYQSVISANYINQ